MKFFKKLKSGNFWVSLISAGVLIAEGIFDFEIKTEYLNQILLGLMGILTLFGIVSDHGESNMIIASSSESKDETKTEEIPVSNIKSICDTISLLLNRVSINSNLDLESISDIMNEVKEINENLHKEAEKLEQIKKEESLTKIEPEEIKSVNFNVNSAESIKKEAEENIKIEKDTDRLNELLETNEPSTIEQANKIEENNKTEENLEISIVNN